MMNMIWKAPSNYINIHSYMLPILYTITSRGYSLIITKRHYDFHAKEMDVDLPKNCRNRTHLKQNTNREMMRNQHTIEDDIAIKQI